MFLVRLGGSCVEEGFLFLFFKNLENNSVLVR